MTVLSPSLPPAICTTMSVRSFATCAMCEPSRAWTLAEATPRLNIAGITIPADTTKRPSFIIALRESFIHNSLLIELVLGRSHDQVQCAARSNERVALAIGQRDASARCACIPGGKVVQQLCTPVTANVTIKQERDEVINKTF